MFCICKNILHLYQKQTKHIQMKQKNIDCIKKAVESVSDDKLEDYIVKALFSLMKTISFEDISITDITKKAGVGRATYYRHFNSKEDVIRYYFTKEMRTFVSTSQLIPQSKDDMFEIMFKILSGLKEKKEVMEILIQTRQERIYIDFLNTNMQKFVTTHWGADSAYVAYFMSGALFNLSLMWIKKGCVESVKKLTDSFVNLMFIDENNIRTV